MMMPGQLLMNPGAAHTPAGRAIAAALAMGFNVDENTEVDDDDDGDGFEIPKHWKVADLDGE